MKEPKTAADVVRRRRVQPIHKIIVRLRNKRGWDQQTLADKARVSKRTVCSFESPDTAREGRTLWSFSRLMDALCTNDAERVSFMESALRAVGGGRLIRNRWPDVATEEGA